jgi:hypothetical protein
MGPEKSGELVENREATFKVHLHLRNLQDTIGENVLSCIYTDISIKKRQSQNKSKLIPEEFLT